MKKIMTLMAAMMTLALSSCTVNQSTGELETTWMFWLLLVFLIILLVVGCFSVSNKNERIKEDGRLLKERAKNNHNITAQVDGVQNSFKFIADDVDKQVIILFPSAKSKTILYADIMGVEIQENGSTIQSKSMMRTVGGALVGNLVAGGAGMIVGGLSGKSKEIKKVSSITVIIKLRNISEPSVNIVCFDAMKHMGVKEIKTNDQSIYGEEYRKGYKAATRIAQIIGVIIDENDRKLKEGHENNNGNSGHSDVEALEKLVAMKEKGLISDEEFAAMKSKIIK